MNRNKPDDWNPHDEQERLFNEWLELPESEGTYEAHLRKHASKDLIEAIEKYIKYYNEKRIKEKLGWMSPVQYRLRLLAA